MKKLFLPALLLLCLAGWGQNRWEYRLTKGDTYQLTLHDRLQWVVDHKGNPVVISVETEANLELTVTRERSRGYDMEGVCRKLSLRVRSDAPGGNEVLFISSEDSNDVSSRVLKQVTGRPFSFTMSKTGELTRLSGLDIALGEAVALNTHLPDNVQLAIKNQLLDAFSDAEMSNRLQLFTHIYPSSAPIRIPPHGPHDSVQTGALRWSVASRVTRPIGFNMVMAYYANDKTTRTIDGRGELKLDFDRVEGSPDGSPTLTYDLYGTMKAEVDTDLKTGWSLRTKIVQDLNGHKIEKGKKDAIKTPQKMHRETLYELTKITPAG